MQFEIVGTGMIFAFYAEAIAVMNDAELAAAYARRR